MNTLYWIDTGFACGGVVVNNFGVIVESAPIFSKFLGQRFENLKRWNRVKEVIECPTSQNKNESG